MIRAYQYIVKLALGFVLLTALGSCDVHQWPEYREMTFVLHLDFETAMPLYKEITYTRGVSISRSSPASCDIRYIVNAYPVGESRTTSARRFVFTKPYDGELDHTVSLDLDEGTWEIYVWTDYVAPGAQADKFYNTSDFSNIIYYDKDAYVGSDDCREAFRGNTTVTLVHPDRVSENGQEPISEATVSMIRPMGRFEFIATDVKEFMTRLAAMTRSENIDDFRAIFRYNAFMPCSYNMFTDKPSDSWTGMSFDSRMGLDEEDNMLLGFDYVLVNGNETQMNINIEIYDSDGTLLSITRAVEVPIVRNKLTIVRGEFLTADASGGVAINPGYEGDDFNVEIR